MRERDPGRFFYRNSAFSIVSGKWRYPKTTNVDRSTTPIHQPVTVKYCEHTGNSLVHPFASCLLASFDLAMKLKQGTVSKIWYSRYWHVHDMCTSEVIRPMLHMVNNMGVPKKYVRLKYAIYMILSVTASLPQNGAESQFLCTCTLHLSCPHTGLSSW